jgi:3-phenylpropionate/trans-cinnamate dioxygenase ferredoxin reductase component
MAGGRAFEALRRRSKVPIVLIGEESGAPYNRPPLSKDFLLGRVEEEAIRFQPPEWYASDRDTFLTSTRAIGLDPEARVITLSDGSEIDYSAVLIATGGTPRRLAVPGDGLPGIHYLRTLPDAYALRAALAGGGDLVIVGAGLIGLEVAAVARQLGLAVTVVDITELPFPALGAELGQRMSLLHQTWGVRFRMGTSVAEFAGSDRLDHVVLADGTSLKADTAVVGIGIAPCTSWLAPVFGSELVGGAIRTGATGLTSFPDVYAAGDVTTWTHPYLGVVHCEQEAVAQNQGLRIAANMLGSPRPFAMVPYAWSDQYDHQLRTVGQANIDLCDSEVNLSGAGGAMASVYVRDNDIVGAATVDWPIFLSRVLKALQGAPLPYRHSTVRGFAAD